MACLDEPVTRAGVEPLVQGITDGHDRLTSTGNTTVVFRDSAFADDLAKINLATVLEQRVLGDMRSL